MHDTPPEKVPRQEVESLNKALDLKVPIEKLEEMVMNSSTTQVADCGSQMVPVC